MQVMRVGADNGPKLSHLNSAERRGGRRGEEERGRQLNSDLLLAAQVRHQLDDWTGLS